MLVTRESISPRGNHDDALSSLINRGGNATVTAVEVDATLLELLRTASVYDKGPEVSLNPTAPLRVDLTKAPDQFGLRTPEHIQWLRASIKQDTAQIIDPKTLIGHSK